MPMAGDITHLLRAHHLGSRDALDRVIALVYEHVLDLAHWERRRHQLPPGTHSLAHAALQRMMVEAPADWQSRGHFFALVARTMRRVMVDDVRARHALKRGGGEPVADAQELDQAPAPTCLESVLVVSEALERMHGFHPRMAQVVECHVFGGLSDAETALALEVPLRTVQRDWQRGRAWLRLALA